jgi:hypothetical protein
MYFAFVEKFFGTGVRKRQFVTHNHMANRLIAQDDWRPLCAQRPRKRHGVRLGLMDSTWMKSA